MSQPPAQATPPAAPAPPADAAAALAGIRALRKRGEFLGAYDLARRALARPGLAGDRFIQFECVLSVARSGSVARALELYTGFGLGEVAAEDFIALNGRLLKDLALAARGPERLRLLGEAAAKYEQALRSPGGGAFSAINAATLNLLAHRKDRAAALAERAATLAAAERPASAGAAYWRHATLAEAALVLGYRAKAEAEIAAAAALDIDDFGNLAATRRQLRLICRAWRFDPALLDPLKPPASLVFIGHMADGAPLAGGPGQGADRIRGAAAAEVAGRIGAWFEGRRFAAAFGALACGSDILFAEACLARDIPLHVVLPFPQNEFVAISVARGGEGWVRRFEACLARRASLTLAFDGSYLGDDALFAYGARLAMGLADLRARQLDTDAVLAAVWDGVANGGAPAGTAFDLAFWRGTGRAAEILPVPAVRAAAKPARKPARPPGRTRAPETPGKRRPPRRLRALIFADVRGFSDLPDDSLPVFHRHFMGRLARVMDRFGPAVLYRNSWGDAIYAVLADAAAGARCALALRDATRSERWAAIGLPAALSLRIGAHFGPVYDGFDYIQRMPGYYGAHVTRTARMEPVTPSGQVYVTEAMAAALVIAGADDMACDYVGTIPLAKNYGEFPMYLLRRSGTAAANPAAGPKKSRGMSTGPARSR